MSDGVVIVGGGLAAQRATETLRRLGYAGPIRMVCAEPHLPYDRPPLSKDVLSGARSEESVQFRSEQWYDEHRVDLLLAVPATYLSIAERRVDLADGTDLRYDRLLIATGSRPRSLPLLAGYQNVSELRTIDDARRLRRALVPGVRLTVIGAGFIGMEVASTARQLGAEVTMLEAAASPLAAVLGEQLGAWFAALHRAQGVRVISERTVAGASGEVNVTSLRLSDGRQIETDHVVVGVGVRPEVEWLQGSGLGNGGVRVDEQGQTEADGVFAAGDVAATFDRRLGRHLPGSHWEAAARQGVGAARAVVGLEATAAPASSFWTDQYGIRIQYLGNAQLADAIVIDGEPATRNFTATFTRRTKPVAALLVDRARSLPAMRKLLSEVTA